MLAFRGDCDFTTKAEVAQAQGAAGLLIINDAEGYYLDSFLISDHWTMMSEFSLLTHTQEHIVLS